MNSSLFHFFISRSTINAPLISLSSLNSFSSFSIKESKFSKLFHNTIFSNFPQSLQIKNTVFKQTLRTSVVIISDFFCVKLSSQRFHSRMYQNNVKVDVDQCLFETCSGETGGGLQTEFCMNIISKSRFVQNRAKIAGGASLIHNLGCSVSNTQFEYNSAQYIGGLIVDCENEENNVIIHQTNFTKNSADMWSAALRADRCGGDIYGCFLQNNSALVSGAFFDFASLPSVRRVNYTAFVDNNSTSRAAVTCFHILQKSFYFHCMFIGNQCTKGPKSISIESINSKISVTNCYFDGPQNEQIGKRFDYSEFIITNCSWSLTRQSCFKKMPSLLTDYFV